MTSTPSFDQLLGSTQARGDAHKAALVLHSVPQSDREWLLSQMKEADRHRLEILLAELEELSIPAQHELLEEITGAEANASRDRADRDDAIVMSQGSPLDGLNDVELRILADILAGESSQLVARLLRSRSWAWTDAVLTQMGHAKRAVIEELLSGSDRDVLSGHAFDAQILHIVERRLLEQQGSFHAERVAPLNGSLVAQWGARLRGAFGAQAGRAGTSRRTSDGVAS